MKTKTFIKNFSVVMLSNIFTLFVATIMTFLVPNFFGEEIYSYFQLENVYCGYIWIISLGWTEGVYIKYGGINLEELKKERLSGEFLIVFIFLLFSGFLLISGSSFFLKGMKYIIFILSTISVVIEIITCISSMLLQAANEMRKYAKIPFLDRVIYFILVLILVTNNIKDPVVLIGVDLIAKLLGCIIALYYGRSFIFVRIISLKKSFFMFIDTIKIGISVCLANYTSRLINGIVQLAIEYQWGLLIFGRVSLTLTISNVFSKFVSAVSLVLFPTLRRSNDEMQITVYNTLDIMLSFSMLGIFCFYLPIKWILSIMLPAYQESLNYLALMLPISLYETKVTMLLNTYFKLLKKQREILIGNVATVFLTIILVVVNVFWLKNLILTITVILVIRAFRCIFEEYRLSKYIKIQQRCIAESVMVILFVVYSWYLTEWIGAVFYFISYVIYLMIYRNLIISMWKQLKLLLQV